MVGRQPRAERFGWFAPDTWEPIRGLAARRLYDKNNQPAEAAYARNRMQSLIVGPTPTSLPP